MASCHTLDQLDSCFDPTHAVANAGLLLAATLAQRLGIEQAADALLDLGERAGAYRPGRRLLPLVHALLAGGDGIDDADLLGCGATSQVLGHRVMALHPGTFLRAFTFGHARQLDRACEQLLMRAWAAGAGPGDGPMTMDLDSTVCEVHGDHQQGAASGYTHTLGYHPPLATRADTARGTARFVDELAARVRRAGASGELNDADGFGVLVGQDHPGLPPPPDPRLDHRAADHADPGPRSPPSTRPRGPTSSTPRWPGPGRETRYQGDRLIVGRTRLIGAQAELFPNWRYHAFVTDRVGTTVELDQDHRRHAVVELCICDLNSGVGLRHCPSGRFAANAAWLLAATLAHNLLRWIAAIGLGARGEPVAAKTLRRTLLALPGRITRSTCRLAVGGVVRAGPGPAALHRLRHLTPRPDRASSHARTGPAPAYPSMLGQRLASSRSTRTGRAAVSIMPPAHTHNRCQPGPTTAPAHQEFRHRWIQARA
jgi:hypothetical protein